MKKILIAFIICISFLSACSFNKDVKEKSSNIGSNSNTENSKDKDGAKKSEDPNKILLPKEYFNVLSNVNGKQVIQNPENDCLLVNTEYFLDSTFTPDDLVIPLVDFSFTEQNVEKRHMRKSAAKSLENLFSASKGEGLHLIAVSGYRSFKRQTELFNAEVQKKGEIEAEKWVARPGTSEHQSGLSMDISCVSFGNQLEQGFDQTKEFQWLSQNAYKYGFILRYPSNKESITKYSYEPWHFRFVGIDVATEMFKRGLSFEEFMMNAKPI